MIRKLFLIAALLCSVQLVTAQTLSDEQVVKMIMEQKENGADENTIARSLLNKGATPAQIRRIKEKYEPSEDAPEDVQEEASEQEETSTFAMSM